MDDRYRNLELYRIAHTFAAFIHSYTFLPPGLPVQQSTKTRGQSKLLPAAIIDAFQLRDSPDKSAIALRTAEMIVLDLLDRIGSTDTPLSPHEREIPRLQADGILVLASIRSALEDLANEGTRSMFEPLPAASRHGGSSRRLEGKAILITRPLRQSRELEQLILDCGGFPVIVPMIEIREPESWDATDSEIAGLQSYHGVVFTSQNAVDALVGRITDRFPEVLSILATREIFAVGEKTKHALENAQIHVTLIPETSSAADLAAGIRTIGLSGKKYLFPKGSLAREELPRVLREANAIVHEIVVYRTVAPDQARLAPLLSGARNGDIDAVTFFSPSSVRNFSEFMGDEIVHQAVAACVGPSTAHEAARIGFGAVLTSHFTSGEGVVQALCDYFEHQPNTPAGGV